MNIKDLPQHHAILLVQKDRVSLGTKLYNELQALSPVHRFFNQTVLDIETARNIIAWANTPYNEEKIALISFHTIGLEAQNTLLKILEEPRNGVRFILITSNTSSLISTVLSRVLLIADTEGKELLNDAEFFLKTSPVLRIKLPTIINILSQEDEEGRKDRESIRAFILSIATVLKNTNNQSKYIPEVMEMASYAADPSASGKALLEYLSLLLPQTRV